MRTVITALLAISLMLIITEVTLAISPDIKANNSESLVTLKQTDRLSVAVSLNPDSSPGVDCDWWVVAYTPFGWYYFDVDRRSWIKAGSTYTGISPTYQGPLFGLPQFEILNMIGLPVGTYIFYFAVDTNMNGSLVSDKLYTDSVNVTVADSDPCSAYAGNWSGTYSETFCDGFSYSGGWTANVTATCSITAFSEGIWYEGTITGNILNASGFDPECGTVSVTGTFTGDGMSGTYTYSLGGSGSFTGYKN